MNLDNAIEIISENEYMLRHYSEVEQYLQSKSQILNYSPVVNGKIIIKVNESLQVAYLTGLDTNKIKKVSGISNKCIAGRYSLANENGIPNIVIGAGLADNLGIIPFDTLFLISPDMIETSIKQMDLSYQIPARASAFFMSYSKEYDETMIFSSIDFAEDIFYKNDKIQRNFDIRLNNLNQIDDIIKDLKVKFPNDDAASFIALLTDSI